MKRLVIGTLSLATTLGAIALGSSAPALSQVISQAITQGITISPQFQPDPMVLQGTSGGTQTSTNCGSIAATPNYEVQLSSDFSYLRFSLRGSGQPTLLIRRLPNGTSSCISADTSNSTINAPGYWEAGRYAISVGDRAGGQNPYTLTITQKRN
jgi:hypothetical protein